MEDTIKRYQALREAGNVERAHTTPHHGGYNVAEHSWNLAVLLYVLHPKPYKKLIFAALFHDVHERWTGDHPSPYKWMISHETKLEMRKLATEIMDELGVLYELPVEDINWLKACDMLEFWLWCHDQLNMGNNHVTDMFSNSSQWFAENWGDVPEPIQHFYTDYYWSRTSDVNGWLFRKRNLNEVKSQGVRMEQDEWFPEFSSGQVDHEVDKT